MSWPAVFETVPLAEIRDARGRLVCGQFPDELPFVPQRFFVISEVPAGAHRGGHAHRTCDQVLVMLRGSCRVHLWDTPETMRTVTLAASGDGLRLRPGTFSRQVDFSADALLMVLASEPFDPGDYIGGEEYFGDAEQRADRK